MKYLIAIAVFSLLTACPGESSVSIKKDSRVDVFVTYDVKQHYDVDNSDAFDPCYELKKEGDICDSTYNCPDGRQAFIYNGNCRCKVLCNPTLDNQCPPLTCAFRCTQLYDSSGNEMTGVGVCLDDSGETVGESCAPAACKLDLYCVGHDNETSFCRQSCQDQCIGYKMVCVALTNGEAKVCLQQGSTTGPTLGESCAADNAYCQQGLICDPTQKICLKMCNTDGASVNCEATEQCEQIIDPNTSIVLGYACR